MRLAGHVARMGEERGVYRFLVGKPKGKRPLGRPRCRWVYNIKMELQEVGCGYMDWIGLTQDRDRWRTTCQLDLTTFLQPRYIPTQGYNITQSSAPDDGHMVARNMLS